MANTQLKSDVLTLLQMLVKLNNLVETYSIYQTKINPK